MNSSRASYFLVGLLLVSAILVASIRSGWAYQWLGINPGGRSSATVSEVSPGWVTLTIDCASESAQSILPDLAKLLEVGVTTVDETLSLFPGCELRAAPFTPEANFSGVIALALNDQADIQEKLPDLLFERGVLSEVLVKH